MTRDTIMKRETSAELVEIELSHATMQFSAAHLTVLSRTSRSNLHGHNFQVAVSIKARIVENGVVCDYRIFEDSIKAICESLDETLLLPLGSPFLAVEESDGLVRARFGHERLQFLTRDVKLIPVQNVTLEELSGWILETFLESLTKDVACLLEEVTLRVGSGRGQAVATQWFA
jgi:6-pyruvoyltetrahydropterin/6-carboxytetrahydropterin synthase